MVCGAAWCSLTLQAMWVPVGSECCMEMGPVRSVVIPSQSMVQHGAVSMVRPVPQCRKQKQMHETVAIAGTHNIRPSQ